MAVAVPTESYREIVFFLVTAGVVVPLFQKLRISPVLGFIGAGAALGPFGLGRWVADAPWLAWFTIASRDEIAHLAEFGVVFLLFMIGIELSWERLRALRRLVFGLGSLQVLTSTAIIAGGAHLFGARPAEAALVGLALSLSSTAIVVPVLAAGRRLNRPSGRATFAVLLFQDLAVAPILFTVAVLSAPEAGPLGWAFVTALGQAALAIAILVAVGRLLLRPLFQLVAATRSPEFFMAACLLVVLVTGLATAAAGLSMALGAFIAGLLLAETEYRRAIEATIDPFKGLLLGVFFVSVGMGLDVSRLAEAPLAILLAAFALVLVKALVVVGFAGPLRLPRPVALESALLLGPSGEFAFVILGAAMAGGLVSDRFGQACLVLTTVTMIAIPALARAGAGIGGRFEQASLVQARARAEPPPVPDQGRVILAGFGRVGQLVGEMLTRHDVPYIAIDADPARVSEQRQLGRPVYYGDSSNPDLLRRCGVAGARALVVTLDNPTSVGAVVAAARAERADLTIVARARDARHATTLYELGVDDAVPETIEASLQLSEAVLVDIGVPIGLVIASIHERRDRFREVLKKSEASGSGSREFRARRTAGKRAP